MVKIKSRPQTARAAKVVVVSNPKVVGSYPTGSTRNKHSALLSLVEHYDAMRVGGIESHWPHKPKEARALLVPATKYPYIIDIK